MPTGPKGEKRPADVIGNAVKVMRIATGEEPCSRRFYCYFLSKLPAPYGLNGVQQWFNRKGA
jgi:hypothetical protein